MQGNLYILTGASTSGKTTLLNDILENGYAMKAPKFAERLSRGPDDDITHIDNIEKSNCDILYVINGKRYGIDTKLIMDEIKKGNDLFVVLSDLRVIRRLKSEFEDRAKAI